MEGPAERAFFVVNPAAGGGRTLRAWPRLRAALAARGVAFESVETTGPASAVALARRAVERGRRLVVAVGGDGTLNEVVNGLADAGGNFRGVLGAIPTGRGCDACRNFGLPTDPLAALARVLDGGETRVDVGAVEWPDGRTRYFLNAAGVGFDAVVARRAASRRLRGTLPYLLAVAETIWAHRPVRAVIEEDGHAIWSGLLTSAVGANGAHYGGGMKIAPAADPADGLLDLVIMGDLGRLELLRWLPTVYRGGHLANPKVTTRRARAIVVRAHAALHVDGEAAGNAPVTISIRPGALRLRR
jgi:YegS/Rv2252/BmrU family lipid kinase